MCGDLVGLSYSVGPGVPRVSNTRGQLSEEKNSLKVRSYEFRNGWAAGRCTLCWALGPWHLVTSIPTQTLLISHQGVCSLCLTLPFAALITLVFLSLLPFSIILQINFFFYFILQKYQACVLDHIPFQTLFFNSSLTQNWASLQSLALCAPAWAPAAPDPRALCWGQPALALPHLAEECCSGSNSSCAK